MSSKLPIDAHPSVVIAYEPVSEKLMFVAYDEGYPKVAYRLSVNLIGGNPEATDSIPENVLIKEVSEEFDPNHPEEKKKVGKVLWAPSEDIRIIRNTLLSNIKPYQDFYTVIGEITGGNKPHTAIFSTFQTIIDDKTVYLAERSMEDRTHVTTEGLLRVHTLEQLAKSERGEFATAHITAPILNHRFGCHLSFPSVVRVEAMGLPRRTYESYRTDFEYNNEKMTKSARAEN